MIGKSHGGIGICSIRNSPLPICNTEFLAENKGAKFYESKENVELALILALCDMAKMEKANVGFHELFPVDSKVFQHHGKTSESYPGKKKTEYDNSLDGLKVLLILLVVSWKRTQTELKTFIAALASETEQFGGAMYRLGGIIFGTQTNPVSRPSIPN